MLLHSVINVRSKKPDGTTTYSVGLSASKRADASLLNNCCQNMFRQDKNPPAGLTSLALHHAMTLQISKFAPLPETRAAAGRVFSGAGRGCTSGLGRRLRRELLGSSLLRPLAAFFSKGHAGAGQPRPALGGDRAGSEPPHSPADPIGEGE